MTVQMVKMYTHLNSYLFIIRVTAHYITLVLSQYLQNVLYEFFINGIAWMPGIVPDCMNLLFKYGNPLPPYNRVDVSYKVFNIPSYFPNHNEAEVVLKLKDCVPAIRELKKFVEEENIPLNFITEVSLIKTYLHWTEQT